MDTQIWAKLGMVVFLLASVPLGILYGRFLPPVVSGKKLWTYPIIVLALLGIFTVISYFETKFLTDKAPTAM